MTDEVRFNVECIASELVMLLMEHYGWEMKRALDELYSSQTFERVNDPECGLYFESSVYIFQFLKNEIETGKIA